MTADLILLRTLGATLRAKPKWAVTALVELDTWQQPQGPARLDLWPGTPPARLCGAGHRHRHHQQRRYLVDLADGRS
ncbi:MAG: hypothetical protein R3A10_15050 [Caldilineaceae bacterium]